MTSIERVRLIKTKPLDLSKLAKPFTIPNDRSRKHDVGVELEKLILNKKTLEPLPFHGDKSIQKLLDIISKNFCWAPEFQNNNIIALKRENELISLEPGGQIELSCPEEPTVDAAASLEKRHLEEIGSVLDEWGFFCCGLGNHPMSPINKISWIPKDRYKLMRTYLKTKGALSHHMMKMTSSIQVSIDYNSWDDAVLKSKTATRLSPILISMFSNSCISEGKLNGFKSLRSHIWQNTDKDRCGLPEVYFRNDFSVEDYIRYALNIPMIFIIRNQTYHSTSITFSEYLKSGFDSFVPTYEDWLNHLSLLFPEIRLKHYIEIRSFDRQSNHLTYAAPTLIKLIFYNNDILKDVYQRLSSFTYSEYTTSLHEASKLGLQGKLGNEKLLDLSKEILQIIKNKLIEIKKMNKITAFEEEVFNFLFDQINTEEESPSDKIIKSVESGRKISEIIYENEILYSDIKLEACNQS